MLTYKDSGVDLGVADEIVERIKKVTGHTLNKNIIGGIGGFSGLYDFNINYRNPVLVSSTDGVGTKLKIAFMMDKHDTVGIDLVAMCVNDVITTGAIPLFLLDYISMGKIISTKVESIITGIVKGCEDASCSLIGGETAEMPDFYRENEYDIAGFCVGVVDKENIVDGRGIKEEDKIVGLPSCGIHSNGYSLVRKVFFDKCKYTVNSYISEIGMALGEELLKPTKIYVRIVNNILKKYKIKGIAHITGGGLEGNIKRIIPRGLKLEIFYKTGWDIPEIFNLIMKLGEIEFEEMIRTFNMGIGMALIVSNNCIDEFVKYLNSIGEKCYIMGKIIKER